MKTIYLQLLNPVKWLKAYRLKKKDEKYDKSKNDLELNLYSKMLTSDMLHYGYFEDTETPADSISVTGIEQAQIRYAQNIIDLINDKDGAVLDVGCGMGGLSGLLKKQDFSVEALTPNKNQVRYIRQKYPDIPVHHCKFEDLETNQTYQTIINSESFQYINLQKGLHKINAITKPGAKWIIVDYFRKHQEGINKTSHMLNDFLEEIEKSNWEIVYRQDITKNVIPMLRFLYLYVERIILPLKSLGYEKLRYKQGFLYHLTQDIRQSLDKKILREIASIDPVKFENEKQYIIFVLQRKPD